MQRNDCVLLSISAPDFGSVSLVESVIDDEKREAGRELQKLTHILEEHNVSSPTKNTS